MSRFVTYLTDDSDEVHCLSEAEFRAFKQTPEVDPFDWEEWVWQEASDKDAAIANHFAKMDEWYANPDKVTY